MEQYSLDEWNRGAHFPSFPVAIESVDGYITRSVTRRQSDGYLPGRRALILDRYPFLIPQMVGG